MAGTAPTVKMRTAKVTREAASAVHASGRKDPKYTCNGDTGV